MSEVSRRGAAADPGVVLGRLEEVLRGLGPLAVAASGGVDSTTLAVVAGRALPGLLTVCHAVSPAVPPEATARVRRHAEREGWRLEVLDAGEFADARYLANPANRCYFCKTNLYAAMAARAPRSTGGSPGGLPGGFPGGLLVSGTNLDDLGDYRPGLAAAAAHGVRHPYVEAGLDKRAVRAVAGALGLADLVDLPAAPCLSSRVETGIAIDARDLRAVHAAEQLLAAALPAPAAAEARSIRCRVRRAATVVELDDRTLAAVPEAERNRLAAAIGALFASHRPGVAVTFEPYRRGSAFLRPAPAGDPPLASGPPSPPAS